MDVVSLFWNSIWLPRRHVNLLHSTLFVSAKTGNKDKGVPRVSVRVSPGSPRIPGTRLRSFANAKVHLVSLAAVFFGCHATLRCVTSKKTVARDTKVHRKLQISTREKKSTKASYLLVQGLVTQNLQLFLCGPECLFLFVCVIKFSMRASSVMLLLIYVSPPIQSVRLMFKALASFDKREL